MRLRITHLAGVGVVLALATLSLSRLDAQASRGVRVCVGTDNVIRWASAGCPSGQRMFRLAEEDQLPTANDRNDTPSAAVSDLRTKVDFLTKRVAALEAEFGKLGNTTTAQARVRAPFEVVDGAGNAIFVVTDADYTGAQRRGRIHIGRATGGSNYSLLARNASGVVVAGLGEGKETGAGALQVNDNAGKLRARLAAADGLEVLNANSGIVAQIKAGSAGAGQFWMYDASGTPMIKAGTTPPGIGLLQAGPGNKCVPSAGLRVPDCILGRASN